MYVQLNAMCKDENSIKKGILYYEEKVHGEAYVTYVKMFSFKKLRGTNCVA